MINKVQTKIRFFISLFFIMSCISQLISTNYLLHSSCKRDCQENDIYFMKFYDYKQYFNTDYINIEEVNEYYNSKYDNFYILGEHSYSDLALPYLHAKSLDPYSGPLLNFPFKSNLFPIGNLIIYLFTLLFSYKFFFVVYLLFSFGLFFFSNYLWLKNIENSVLYSLILTFGSYPFLFSIDRGNLETIIAPLVSISIFYLINNKFLFFAIIFIFAASFKGIHLIFMYLLLHLRNLKLFLTSFSIFVILNYLSLLIFKSAVITSLSNYLQAAQRLLDSNSILFNSSLYNLNSFLIKSISSRYSDDSLSSLKLIILDLLKIINQNFLLFSLILSIYFIILIFFKFQNTNFKLTIVFLSLSIMYLVLYSALAGPYRLIFIQISLVIYLFEISKYNYSNKALDVYFSILIYLLFPIKMFFTNLYPVAISSGTMFLMLVVLIHFPRLIKVTQNA